MVQMPKSALLEDFELHSTELEGALSWKKRERHLGDVILTHWEWGGLCLE